MTTAELVIGAWPRAGTARRWARAHLFSSPFNVAITVLLGALGIWFAYTFIVWAAFEANWGVVHTNRRLLLLGRYPRGEEWRIWPVVFMFTALVGLSWGRFGRIGPRTLALLLGGSAVVVLMLTGDSSRATTVAAIAFGWAAYGVAALVPRQGVGRMWLARAIILGWVLLVPVALLLLFIRGGVDASRWGGLYLNLIVGMVSAFIALPLGLLLALGRTSSYRGLARCCAVIIDLLRGQPLIVVLTLAWLALRAFMPPIAGLQDLSLLTRVILAYSIFTSAFIAEAIRGGMRTVTRGQLEAAAALGMRGWQVTLYIVLPQALRRAIPSLAGELIDLLMATTLVSVVGLTDMLAAARATTEQPDFFGRQREVLLVVGAIFWVGAFALSKLSRRLERALAISGRPA